MSTKHRKRTAKESSAEIPERHIGWSGSHFRKVAFKDYIGARVLLNNDLALQGVVLASTCIEKYLKAVLASAGRRTGVHLDRDDFLSVMKAHGVDVTSYINATFIHYLGRAYAFRYIEPTNGPASIGVEKYKLLAGLDYCVGRFEASLVVTNPSGSIEVSLYAAAVNARDERVWTNNYVLNALEKTAFVEQPSPLYGAFAAPLHEFVELTHPRFKATNDGNFDLPTFTVEGNRIGMSFAPVAGRFE